MGHGATDHRHDRRPLRVAPDDCCGAAFLLPRAARHVLGSNAGGLHAERRGLHRDRVVGYGFRGDLRCAEPHRAAGEAQLGAWGRGRCRRAGTIFHGAGFAGAAVRSGLGQRTGGAWRALRRGASACIHVARQGGWQHIDGSDQPACCAERGVCAPWIPAAQSRFSGVRVPAFVHRYPPAGLPDGQRPEWQSRCRRIWRSLR
jgi:hypothetical protein